MTFQVQFRSRSVDSWPGSLFGCSGLVGFPKEAEVGVNVLVLQFHVVQAFA